MITKPFLISPPPPPSTLQLLDNISALRTKARDKSARAINT